MAVGERKITLGVRVSSWRANAETELGAHDINLGRGRGSEEARKGEEAGLGRETFSP